MWIFTVPTEKEKKVLTMAEYIEREALMRRIKEIHCAECDSYHGVRCRACWVDDTLDYIDSEPAADVAEVVHGRWIWNEEGEIDWEQFYRCSNCGDKEYWESNFCPNCGAKMDLEDNDG